MSSLTSPRGPLPPRVYWFRRLLVLGVAFVLVFGLARVFGGGSDGGDTAAQVGSDTSQTEAVPDPAAPTSPAPTGPAPTGPASTGDPAGSGAPSAGPTLPPPAEPEGECAPDDVSVEPAVWRPVEGDRVQIGLDVTSLESPACYWEVSAESLTMKITSGDDDIWSTRQCPAAVPERRAVVRDDRTTKVVVEWSGRRSDDECSTATALALPGFYIVEAAALAGEPSSVQFQLRAPSRPEITRSPSPTPDEDRRRDDRDRDQDRGPSTEPAPTGAVEPDGE